MCDGGREGKRITLTEQQWRCSWSFRREFGIEGMSEEIGRDRTDELSFLHVCMHVRVCFV